MKHAAAPAPEAVVQAMGQQRTGIGSTATAPTALLQQQS